MEPVSLPLELWEMIISYICDYKDLQLCSLTCRSWCATAKPRLHYDLRTSSSPYEEPKRLQNAYELGLLPWVNRLDIVSYDFTPLNPLVAGSTLEPLSTVNFSYFSAFNNLRDLRIHRLEVSSFIPDIHRCFGPVTGTLQSIALETPQGSCRQLLYFIGHFKNLQNLRLSRFRPAKDNEGKANLDPPHKPPLTGRLSIIDLTGDEFVKKMIDLYELRFRCVNLYWVEPAAQILEACANTLKTLQLHEEDLGQDRNRFGFKYAAPVSMSLCKSLQTLRITPDHLSANDRMPGLPLLLSAIVHPESINVVIVYQQQYFNLCSSSDHVRLLERKTGDECVGCNERHLKYFKILSEAYKKRNFRLTLCAEVPGSMVDLATMELERIVKTHKIGELNELLSGSSIICTIPPF